MDRRIPDLSSLDKVAIMRKFYQGKKLLFVTLKKENLIIYAFLNDDTELEIINHGPSGNAGMSFFGKIRLNCSIFHSDFGWCKVERIDYL